MVAGLCDLPEELLTQIVEEVCSTYENRDVRARKSALKTLREAARSFTYLPTIEKRLFTSVIVHGTAAGLETVNGTALRDSSVARCATKVTFLLPNRSQSDTKQVEEQEHDSKNLRILNSGKLRVAWTLALEELHKCKSISLGDTIFGEDDLTPNTRFMGDACFAAAVCSISQADISPHHLEVHLPMSGRFGWHKLPGWTELDLSQLETFIFDSCAEPHERFLEGGGHVNFVNNTNSAIASVMSKSSPTLEQFFYSGRSMSWPGEEVVALPQLRVLELEGDGDMNVRNIMPWIRQMPRLQRIRLNDIGVAEPGLRAWRLFYDAVKLHMLTNKPKQFECDWRMDLWDGPMITFRQDLGKVDHFLEEQPDEEWFMEFDRALALYMTGHAGWTRALRFMIDGYTSDSDIDTDEDEPLEASYFDRLDVNGSVQSQECYCDHCELRRYESGVEP